MSEPTNYGKKGYCVVGFFVALLLFVLLWAYMYYSNQNGLG